MTAKRSTPITILVIHGDDPHRKDAELTRALDTLLPPEVDRSLALAAYDASQSPERGGPTLAGVMDDLRTLPFLADRRVVVIRDADRFISANREYLEDYAAKPSPTGTLVLVCRSFPSKTRLAKALPAAGGKAIECKQPKGRALVGFVLDEAANRNKRITPEAAEALVNLAGAETGTLSSEIEKLSLYAADRQEITAQDVIDLVGLSREEKIFAVVDAAALGNLEEALRLWSQVLETDPKAVFKATGGVAYKLRAYLEAQQLRAAGAPDNAVIGKAGLWGRPREALNTLLRRQPAHRLRRALAALADLDLQAKTGLRSIERGVEVLLVRLAGTAR